MCFTVDARGKKYSILSRQGQKFTMMMRDTFQFGPECVARGFQTLFIMREEGVMLIDKRDRSFNILRYF